MVDLGLALAEASGWDRTHLPPPESAGPARLLRAAGAASVDVAVTHALFAGDALDLLRAAGVGEVWSSDCIPHPSNAVSVAPLLAGALAGLGVGAG